MFKTKKAKTIEGKKKKPKEIRKITITKILWTCVKIIVKTYKAEWPANMLLTLNKAEWPANMFLIFLYMIQK